MAQGDQMTAALRETHSREPLPRPQAAPAKWKRVVIVGGGSAGIAAARALRRCDAEVILIDRRNHHIFQPLLYQVATAVLAPAEIAAPIRQIEEKQKNLTVMLAEGHVRRFDFALGQRILPDIRAS
jgi:NADH:ubiquinone reductase (H+-translocating)